MTAQPPPLLHHARRRLGHPGASNSPDRYQARSSARVARSSTVLGARRPRLAGISTRSHLTGQAPVIIRVYPSWSTDCASGSASSKRIGRQIGSTVAFLQVAPRKIRVWSSEGHGVYTTRSIVIRPRTCTILHMRVRSFLLYQRATTRSCRQCCLISVVDDDTLYTFDHALLV